MEPLRIKMFTKAKIYEAYQGGQSKAAIAREYNLPYYIVNHICTVTMPNYEKLQKEMEEK